MKTHTHTQCIRTEYVPCVEIRVTYSEPHHAGVVGHPPLVVRIGRFWLHEDESVQLVRLLTADRACRTSCRFFLQEKFRGWVQRIQPGAVTLNPSSSAQIQVRACKMSFFVIFFFLVKSCDIYRRYPMAELLFQQVSFVSISHCLVRHVCMSVPC